MYTFSKNKRLHSIAVAGESEMLASLSILPPVSNHASRARRDATRGRDLPGRPVQSVRFASSSSRRGHARVTLELSSACSLDWSNAARIYVGYSVKAGHAPDVVVRFIYIRRSRLLKKLHFLSLKEEGNS